MGEAELAKELGVSRGPLREAMQRLTQEGLLISIRNRGLFVITMTEAEVRDMYVARTAVERAASEVILQKDGKLIAARLLEIVKAMDKAAKKATWMRCPRLTWSTTQAWWPPPGAPAHPHAQHPAHRNTHVPYCAGKEISGSPRPR